MTPQHRRDAQALLRKHYEETLELERHQLQQLVPQVDYVRDAFADELDEWTEDAEEDGARVVRFKPEKYKAAVAVLAAVAVKLGGTLRASLVDGIDDTQNLAMRHTVVEIAHFSRALDEITDSRAIRDQLADLSTSGAGSLVPRFETSAQRYTGTVYDDLKDRLAGKILDGARVSDMVDELVKDGGPKGLVAVTGIAGDDDAVMEWIPEGLFARYRDRAETYVRTEMAGVYGQQTQDALEQAAEVVPEIQKRWCAEDGACEACEALDGQIVDVDDQFESDDGEAFDYPPAHPRCRCRHTPWFEGQGEMKSDIGNVDTLVDRDADEAA